MPKEGVSIQVIRRLPRYYRYLSELEAQGVEKISSTKLASVMSSTASQIRQDLNCFGGFGQQGYGYSVAGLREEIGKIKSPYFKSVRGKGLLNAVITEPQNGIEAWDICLKMAEKGLLAKPTHRHIIRFAPPLVITEEQLREAVGIIREVFENM